MIKKEPTRRDVESAAKKEHILKTAIDLFKTYGYEKTTIADISKASGMSTGSIYHFFSSKDNLLSQLNESIEDLEISRDDWEKKLANPVGTIMDLLLEYAERWENIGAELTFHLVDYFDREYSNMDDGTLKPSLKLYTSMSEFIEECQKNCTFDDSMPPLDIANFICIVGRAIVLDWCHYRGRYSLREKSRDFMPRIIRSFLAENTNK